MSIIPSTKTAMEKLFTDNLGQLNFCDWLANNGLPSVNNANESWSIDELSPFRMNIKKFLKAFTGCSEEESSTFEDSIQKSFEMEEEYAAYLTRITPIMNNGGKYYFQIMLWYILGLITETRYELLQSVPLKKLICRAWVVNLCAFQNVNTRTTTVTKDNCFSCRKMHSMLRKAIPVPGKLESEISQIMQRNKTISPSNIGISKSIPGGFEITFTRPYINPAGDIDVDIVEESARTVIKECSANCNRKYCKNSHPDGWDFRNNIDCSKELCCEASCPFKHEDDWDPKQNSIDYANTLNSYRSQIPCKFGAKCTNNKCAFSHTQIPQTSTDRRHTPCKFGSKCNNANCTFGHPSVSQMFVSEKPIKKNGKKSKNQPKRAINTSYLQIETNSSAINTRPHY